MSERLCSCCYRKVEPLDDNEYVEPRYKYGPGLCVTCQTFSLALRQGISIIKNNVVPTWMKEHREDLCKVLFAEIGEEG